MRIVEIRERTLPISRYAAPAVSSGGLTTSAVAVVIDVQRGGDPVTAYGFASIGGSRKAGSFESASRRVCSLQQTPSLWMRRRPISIRSAPGR
jgi:hypothetical protein